MSRKEVFFHEPTLRKIGDFLKNRSESVSVAESATAGFLQLAFSQILHASHVYKGGITAYTAEEKIKLLHVNPLLAAKTDCVSAAIATQMALGAAGLFNTEWSIGTTGYATPVPESEYKCFVFFSICHNNKPVLEERIYADAFPGQMEVQHFYVEKILEKWHRCIG